VAAPPSPARRWHVPTGRYLSSADAARRHALVCSVALLHVPALLAVCLRAERPEPGLWALAPALALLGVAAGPFAQGPRAVAAAGSLLSSTLGLGLVEPVLQPWLLVVVALLALYQDAQLLVLAAAVGAVGLSPEIGGFALVEALVLSLFWWVDAATRTGDEQLQAALWEGQASVRARLEETERIRTDLIGTVSHEFRTPLTGIRGAALTLLKRGERLDEAGRRQLLQAVLEQQERLSRLLENMLTAARATSADPAATAEVDAVAAEVAMLAGAARPDSPQVSVVVEPGLLARIDRHALHQVLANLVDNAQRYGRCGSVPLVAGGRDGDEVWLAVSNEGGPLDATGARHLFEPFTQGEAGTTRSHEGLGMGLYVVRRLVEVHGGWVSVRAEGGWVTVEVRLEAAEDRRRQAPTADPIAYVRPAATPPSAS
jgi:signal transduction histidine kinase